MNYQKIDPKGTCAKSAAQFLDVPVEMLLYYAWPQMYSSTAGPFHGIAGQAMSMFTIEAYSDGKDAILFCKNKHIRKITNFDPCKAVSGEYR